MTTSHGMRSSEANMSRIMPTKQLKINQLTFIRELAQRNQKRFAQCRCDCGQVWKGCLYDWWYGYTKSCGCERLRAITKHGACGSREYKIWEGILARCRNPNNCNAKKYQSRGITVCNRWLSFENFLTDMGPCPTPTAQIDRRHNDKGYTPHNCRWAERPIQQQNTRRSRIWIIEGIRYPSCRVAAIALGVSSTTIRNWCGGNESYLRKANCGSRLKYQ